MFFLMRRFFINLFLRRTVRRDGRIVKPGRHGRQQLVCCTKIEMSNIQTENQKKKKSLTETTNTHN